MTTTICRWIWSAISMAGLLAVTAVPSTASDAENYYSSTCPEATTIVRNMVTGFVKQNRNLAGALQRLHFHDCFVRGCDASVLLSSPFNTAEKDSISNKNSLRGFEEIDEIKAALESSCPGIVSCADILALTARDATVKAGGPSWSVALGRKDGFVSLQAEADKLPAPFMSYAQLAASFAAVGLSEQDMVALSGAHTIGRAQCGSVLSRLYDFNGVTNSTDPSMDKKLVKELKKKCPHGVQPGNFLPMDPTKNTFDHLYFTSVLAKRGLLGSDAQLLNSPVGLDLVTKYSQPGSSFFSDFAAAMVRMGSIQWATQGEVRINCSQTNS
ncbi:peroxidase [Marchantia polymorpha subsp. ruderalis]